MARTPRARTAAEPRPDRQAVSRRGILLALAALALSSLAGSLRAEREGAEKERASKVATGFRSITEEQRDAVRRGLDHLASRQDPHKGFIRPGIQRGGPGGQSGRVAITALSVLSFLANGSSGGRGPYGEAVEKGVRYLLRTASQLPPDDRAHGYISTPGDDLSRMHGHGYATLALAEALGMFGTDAKRTGGEYSSAALHEKLTAAVRLIERTQTSDGGWGYQPDRTSDHEGSITVCQLQALRSAHNAGIGVDPLTIKDATEYLVLSQQRDGSFAYSLHDPRTSYALTAAAVSTFHARGIYDSPEVRRGMDYLLRNFDGFLDNPTYFFYGSFYAGQAMYHARQPLLFERWFEPIRARLLRTQAPDGSWEPSEIESDLGSAYATAMGTLILQIPYGYLPIFQR